MKALGNGNRFYLDMYVSIVSELSSITVKFVLKLFQTYITSDYFLYLCNDLAAIAIPRANGSQTGVSVEYGL